MNRIGNGVRFLYRMLSSYRDSLLNTNDTTVVLGNSTLDIKKLCIGELERVGYVMEIVSRQIQNSREEECKDCLSGGS